MLQDQSSSLRMATQSMRARGEPHGGSGISYRELPRCAGFEYFTWVRLAIMVLGGELDMGGQFTTSMARVFFLPREYLVAAACGR